MSAKGYRLWLLRWGLPGGVLASVLAASFYVWQIQVAYQHSLLARHTEDTAAQLAKRLELIMGASLRATAMAGRSWARDEALASRAWSAAGMARFDEVADGLLETAPDIDLVAFVAADLSSSLVSSVAQGEHERSDEERRLLASPPVRALIAAARTHEGGALSPPFSTLSAGWTVLAAVPVASQGRTLGFLVVGLPAETLARECFDGSLLSEFDVVVEDVTGPSQSATLVRSTLAGSRRSGVNETELIAAATRGRSPASAVAFPVRNRTWRVTVVSKAGAGGASAWLTVALLIPLLGVAMAFGIAAVVFMLVHRMEMSRQAHNAALEQIEKRREIEAALRFSEERYRDVFASASDGLIVLEPGRRILEANAAAGVIFGCQPLILLGGVLEDGLAAESRASCAAFIETLTTTGEARAEVILVRQTGEHIDVELRGTPLHHDPHRRFLVVLADVSERKLWGKYMDAYDDMLRHTSTKWAPWHVVPADNKWYTRLAVIEVIIARLEKLELRYPKVSAEQREELTRLREALVKSDG